MVCQYVAAPSKGQLRSGQGAQDASTQHQNLINHDSA